MKRVLLLFLLAALLAGCTAEPVAVSEPSGEHQHDFGDEPVQVVGNLDIYECKTCGYQNVIANGIPLG